MSDATILLLPGNMCDARLWEPVRARLRARGIDAIAQAAPTGESIPAMAAAILERQTGSLVPIGFSMGAIVAATMAAQRPDRVRALGLIAFNADRDQPARAAVRPRQQADVTGGALASVIADELKPAYLAAANSGDAELLALLMAMAMDVGAEGFVAQSEALRTRGDLRPTLSQLSVPVLLATGAEDRLCPPKLHHAWARLIGANATTVIVEGAGHMLPLEQPARTADLIEYWLEDAAL